MRTERVVLFGTHFFCVLEWARFLHTWALGKMLCYPLFLPNFAASKGREDIEKLNGNDLFHSAY